MGSNSTYTVSDQWIGHPRPVRVVIIGAGIGGIAAVKLFRETFQDRPTTLIIYEKNHDVGGTWLENRYPGCSVDNPGHTYTYSWEGNPSWSRAYIGAEEVFEYYKGRAKAYGVYEYVNFNHRVIEARWDDYVGQWKLNIEKEGSSIIEDECEVLINWKWPSIDGLNTYKGHLVHSAIWDPDYSFKGKTIGVIGSGSSAIQMVPQLQKEVKSLISFNRSPSWITQEFAAKYIPEGRGLVYSNEQREEWRNNPNEFLKYRKELESIANKFWHAQFKDGPVQEECTYIRLTPGHGYLEALAKDNVVVRSDEIRRITPTGVQMVDGTNLALDAIICATGFDNSFRSSFALIGENGVDLRDEWREEPRSYLSVAAAGFPNYFMATRPNFPLANGSLVACLEQTLKYGFRAVKKVQTQGLGSVSPTREAVSDFQEHKDAIIEKMVWTSPCRSWYKNGKVDGKVWGPYPGSVPHFFELMSETRWEDFKIEYRTSNRFQYLGRGNTHREVSGGDLAWYVTEPGADLAA
ncbi:hypothetical protein THAR02_05579 [Trichoderma harzianum]|uniref:Uncharacterized protein n=1 Tax=Trichoderma harzianum TaxID=5544 RepID=A0A0G0ABE4_TRIHA|nr:hypothetical protein THAR02_05579 [Trichoderma harzianum]